MSEVLGLVAEKNQRLKKSLKKLTAVLSSFEFRAGKKDWQSLEDIIGTDAREFIENTKGAKLLMFCRDDDTQVGAAFSGDLYVVEYLNRVMILQGKYIAEQRVRSLVTDQIVTEPPKRQVFVDFMYREDFQEAMIDDADVFSIDKAVVTRHDADETGLQYLSWAKDFIFGVRSDCSVELYPSDAQRERIYTRAFRELPNVTVHNAEL